jgi:cell division septation protein DedD
VDLTHDASDDGFHEIQLNGKQLVFLFMATTVVSVVIFLCGVLVGRGVRAQQLLGEEPATNPPLAAAAPTDTVAETGPTAAEPPTPPAESSEPAPGASQPPQPDKPVETPAPAPAKSAEETRGAPPPPVAASEPVSSPPPAATSAPAQAPAPTRAMRGPQGSSADKWVVQIVALRDRSMAGSIVERLSGKGYPAFVVNPSAGTPAPVFKVQVGRYADREQAEQVARRLEKEEQFKPWVSR